MMVMTVMSAALPDVNQSSSCPELN